MTAEQLFQNAAEIGPAPVAGIFWVSARGSHLFQIMAGTEYRAIGGQNNHPNRGIVACRRQCAGKRGQHRLREGVARCRIIQRQAQDTVTVTNLLN